MFTGHGKQLVTPLFFDDLSMTQGLNAKASCATGKVATGGVGKTHQSHNNGTSTSTPTTVASAAAGLASQTAQWRPPTASSKKFNWAPDHTAGAATQWATFQAFAQP